MSPLEIRYTYESQGKHPAWSEQTESQLIRLIAAQPNLALSSIEVDCRETICRLTLVGLDIESDAYRALRYDLHHPALRFDQVMFLSDPSVIGAHVSHHYSPRTIENLSSIPTRLATMP